MTEDFSTTDAFIEGAEKSYPAGANVAWIDAGTWDGLAGIFDFSEFVKAFDIVDITDKEIDEICVIS